MGLQTGTYIRKSFPVEAVQVTEENFEAVATWCGGQIEVKEDGTRYIRVRVHQPLNVEQTHAYVGRWILYARKGYKVFTDRAFRTNFVPGSEAHIVNVTNIFNTPSHDENEHSPVDPSDQISGKR